MGYLLVRHKVKEFQEWKRVFDAHKDAQVQAGLRIEKVMRNLYEANEVFLFFEVTDLAKARGFVFGSEVARAQEESGIVDKPDIYFLA
jgi:predicted signal transduction protein with EAL and GGDEF domain